MYGNCQCPLHLILLFHELNFFATIMIVRSTYHFLSTMKPQDVGPSQAHSHSHDRTLQAFHRCQLTEVEETGVPGRNVCSMGRTCKPLSHTHPSLSSSC